MPKPTVRHCFGEEVNVYEVQFDGYLNPVNLAAGLKALAKDIYSRYNDQDVLSITITSAFDSLDGVSSLTAVVQS